MDISVDQFTIDLYGDVIALWQACEGVGLSNADSKENIARYLQRNPGMSFVARCDQQVVGAVLAGHDGRRGYLHHLAVHPQFRLQGIGQRLVDSCLQVLKQAGIEKCHLFIFNQNETGMAFWTAQGWELRRDISVMSRAVE